MKFLFKFRFKKNQMQYLLIFLVLISIVVASNSLVVAWPVKTIKSSGINT